VISYRLFLSQPSLFEGIAYYSTCICWRMSRWEELRGAEREWVRNDGENGGEIDCK
jgi:hypothetical protein